MKNNEIKNILIVGAAGGLARITCGLICKKYPNAKVIGIDNRNDSDPMKRENFTFKRIKYTRGNFEALFREQDFDIVLHLGRLSHSKGTTHASVAQRLDLNVMGTGRILDLCLRYKVKRVIILSTHHVYGALNDNPVYIKEDSPLRASIKYPELRDVTEMDQLCANWMWKNQGQIETVILRPCNIIGPQINNSISQYLKTPYAPVGIDFNPMFQFIHEFDMARILVKSMRKIPTGIYNIAPDESISLRAAKEIIGMPILNAPIVGLEPMAKVIKKLWSFPDYLLDYIKYSCIIDNSEIKKYLKDDGFRFSTRESLELLKLQ
ncbi:NAD-dependent epimerase/dehydratase family protein [Halobacteriovorax sp. GB3]|uniref:NAD-dependent epimerase/dehydratase family protein n=1 Tax=Halobacteriovorax sp. GB3 TaxID=2719615 RepID=UPI0023610DE7|nr:NAD-dependent epimerase/dehydratase family protein [Halobacteriovorax sp. GB3]MDD0854844.1 NAD-dependent epimerase/dehydratase family protein [Halobacteriovorax sp. GB3]